MPEGIAPDQGVQLVGAVLILGGYILLQTGVLRAGAVAFSLLNLAGASLLAWEALRTEQWGFFLLEGSWAVVSAAALHPKLRRRPGPSNGVR